MNHADNEIFWENITQLVNYIDTLKKQIKQLEHKYRNVNTISLAVQGSQADHEKELITCKKLHTVIFKTETLIPVIQEAIKDNCNVCLVKNHGLFIISENSDNNFDELNISYAEGFDPEQYGPDELYKLQDALHNISGPGVCVGRIPVDNTALRHVLEYKTDLEATLIPMQFSLRAIE
ncbi:hypothetical protein FDX19_05600 [Citrobacter sp. wls619]|uniref:hypothetical protein n=1 Tax=Citrobacter sp. wls619 TaxID=2576432 RepID=UPI0010C980BB|nr:hypothetical protein [Citrobacter sp. wls619]TKV11706.1 hypothetical protein FDX19_05600 [Citrobacter sp. wls619]